MTRILAIDPGNTDSAYVVIDHATRRPLNFGKIPNEQLLDRLIELSDDVLVAAIEMVASYGMPVGADVFETCVWIGRYQQLLAYGTFLEPDLVKRHPVKLHHCQSTRAKDSNITQALVDRFAPGQPNRGKGTKAAPGWFHGFAADVWQAYALAVYVADTTPLASPAPTSGRPPMCDRTDWPCVNDATHTAPAGCVHHATTDDLGDHGRHSDETQEDD